MGRSKVCAIAPNPEEPTEDHVPLMAEKTTGMLIGELAGLFIAWGAVVFCVGLVVALNLWAWALVGELFRGG